MTDTSYTAALSDLARDLRLKLMSTSEEYRLLAALEQLIAGLSARSDAPDQPGPSPVNGRSAYRESVASSAKSLRTSVYEILAEAEGPLPIGEILDRLKQRGVGFTARNPRAALSSNMSQDARFENGVVGGRPMWRIKAEAKAHLAPVPAADAPRRATRA